MKHLYLLVVALLVLFASCEKTGEENANKLPDTKIAFEEIDLSGDDRLTSSVRLSWFGTDGDGYITGFEISIDNGDWFFTEKQDSTFRFLISAGGDSADISFQVRAIDNDNILDPTPASLIIPIKNTAPIATIDNSTISSDSTLVVLTFDWSVEDPDGFETLQEVQIKANDGSWTSIPYNEGTNLISIVPQNPTQLGLQSADIYLGTANEPAIQIDGFINGDSNTFFLKSIDIANKESVPDLSLIHISEPTRPY